MVRDHVTVGSNPAYPTSTSCSGPQTVWRGCGSNFSALLWKTACANVTSFWPLNPRFTDIVPWSPLEKTLPHKILLGSDYPAGQTPKEAAEAVRGLPSLRDSRRRCLERTRRGFLGYDSLHAVTEFAWAAGKALNSGIRMAREQSQRQFLHCG